MDKLKTIKKITEDLLNKLAVTSEVEVVDEDETPTINIRTEEGGILIGYHGETLNAFSLVLSLIASRELGEFARINVDVGGYRRQRQEKLVELAKNIKEQVLRDGQEIPLPNLTSSERRIVHLFFQDDKEVITESQGEGDERQLIIKPR